MLIVILKIIGTILLAILGIIILALCVVLLVPLRYVISAESKGNMETSRLEIKFHWLLHLFSGRVLYENQELNYKVRALWMKLADSEEEAKPSQKTKEAEEISEEIVTEDTSTNESKVEAEPKAESVAETEAEPTEEVKSETKAESKKKESKENKLEKLKCTIKNLCDKIKMVLEFIKDEAHINTLTRLKKEFIRLLKFLKPKKLKGKVRFGMEDPYVTGQILAVLSVFYPFYAERVEIYPEFDQKILEGNLYVKGHVRGIYALIMAFNLIIDKNVRTTIKDVQALF